MKPSDLESLIAYLDDELDAGARAAMEARLEVNAELRSALAGLKANDVLLVRALEEAEAEAGDASVRAKVDSLIAGHRPRRARAWGGLALAASLAALALGIGLGTLISGQRFEARLSRLEAARVSDARAIERVVSEALEKQLSGQSARWQSQETGTRVVVTPVRTYRAESGKWCREFTRELDGKGGREALRGIACRDGDGVWRPQLWRPAAAQS